MPWHFGTHSFFFFGQLTFFLKCAHTKLDAEDTKKNEQNKFPVIQKFTI